MVDPRNWRAKWDAFWSKYKPPHPAVILRVAAYEVGDGRAEELAPEAAGQIAQAATAIKERYGTGVTFQVYAVNSNMTSRSVSTAQLLAEALQPQTDGSFNLSRRLLGRFLQHVELSPGAVLVIVANQPTVEDLLADMGLGGIVADHAVPHFFTVSQAKLQIDQPPYKVAPDPGP